MTHPKGCIMTGENKVQGQCDSRACNYPFCESRPKPERHAWDDLFDEVKHVRRA
jgi:hypothetical protein